MCHALRQERPEAEEIKLREKAILVTGGAGFIGSNIVAGLNELGERNVVVCDLLGQHGKWQNLRKHLIKDIVAPRVLPEWLAAYPEVSAVIHMGANSSTLEVDGDAIADLNIRFSLRLLEWCTAHGVPLIYASSAATYGNAEMGFDDAWSVDRLRALRPLNLYGWSKCVFDLVVADRIERGLPLPPVCVGLKFFNVFGPNEYHKGPMMSVVSKFFETARSGGEIRLFKSYRPDCGHGEQRRDFVYVRDVVDVVLHFLRKEQAYGIYNLGSGRARSYLDLVHALFDSVGQERRVSFVDMPAELRPRYQYFTEADLGRLRGTGFNQPMTELEDGIGHFVRTYLSSPDPYC